MTATRLALHALAERVVSPLRVQATGHEIALRVVPGGFATPPLPDGTWAGVVGGEVVGPRGAVPVTSLRAAAEHLGLDGAAGLPDEPLAVDPAEAAAIARAWAIGQAALEVLVGPEGRDAIHLWPEHFDVAAELGDEAAGGRATYGVSPGDEHHPKPYAYVAPWVPQDPSALWNATGFGGAEALASSVLELYARGRAALG